MALAGVVSPAVRMQSGLCEDEAALAKVAGSQLGRLAEADQRVELGLGVLVGGQPQVATGLPSAE